VAASTAASPWIIGLNHIGRQTILLDPTWPEAERGLALARQLAQMSYRAEPGLEQRQGRALRAPPSSEDPAPFTDLWSPRRPYAQETYLEHQGRKLVARFDAPSYLVQLAAMDHHDLARRPPTPTEADAYDLGPDPWPGVGRLSAPIDAVGIDTDVLYFPRHMRALGQGPGRAYHEIASPHGHDAFLIEWDQLDALLRAAGAPFAEPT
jgi:homoserine O-acetyltransferase